MEDLAGVMQRLHELREAIHLHQYQYYVENRPSLSDAEYDALFRELQALETAILSLLPPIHRPSVLVVSPPWALSRSNISGPCSAWITL